MKHIDRIKVREAQKRFETRAVLLSRGAEAARALVWFAEHAVNENHRDRFKPSVLQYSPQIIASSTADANLAQRYVDKATATFLDAILTKAVEMAQHDYDCEAGRDE